MSKSPNKSFNKILTVLFILISLGLFVIFKPFWPKISSVAPATPSPTQAIKEDGVAITLNEKQTPTLQHLSSDNESNVIQLDPSQVTPEKIRTVFDDTTPKPPPPQILAEFPMKPYGPKEVATNRKTGYVYIATGWEVAILTNTTEITRVTTGSEPRAIAVDSNNNRVYVTNYYSNTVTIIQDTKVLTTIAIAGQQPQDVTVDPKTKLVYVISGYEDGSTDNERIVAGNITVISGTQIIKVIPLGRLIPMRIIFDPINNYVYIGSSGGWVIVIKDLAEISRFNLGSTITAMDVNPHTGDVYLISAAPDYNFAHLKNGALIDTLDLREKSNSFNNLKVHPTTGDVYVIDSGSKQAVVVRDMTVIARIPLGWRPYKMTIDPLSGNVYVANFEDDTVTVINGTTVLTTIEVGWYPYGIGVNPLNGWVYVSNTNDHTITILGYPD